MSFIRGRSGRLIPNNKTQTKILSLISYQFGNIVTLPATTSLEPKTKSDWVLTPFHVATHTGHKSIVLPRGRNKQGNYYEKQKVRLRQQKQSVLYANGTRRCCR